LRQRGRAVAWNTELPPVNRTVVIPFAHRRRARAARAAQGLSVVELMVGLAVGMFIAAAALVSAVQLTESNRRVLLEARLNQDMRATMDMVTRHLRRAGYWGNAQAGARGADGSITSYASTGYAEVTPAGTAASAVSLRIAQDADDLAESDETFEFRLEPDAQGKGRLQVRLAGATSYQDLTDPAITDVRNFSVEPRNAAPVALSCPGRCGSGSLPACPTLQVRRYDVSLTARASFDPVIQRTLQATVRLRNDALSGACP
jgi:type IV pilus assembly protein PilW